MGEAGPGKAETQVLRVAESLKRMILNNDFPPGGNLLESELGEMLGVSRTPVREAAVILQAKGLVEIQPRRGIRILPLTIADLEEIYDILTELEPLAAQRAAEARPGAERLAPLTGHVARMEAALDAGDLRGWAEADERFHAELVALSGNRRLMRAVETVSDQAHRARLLTLHMRPFPSASNRDHRAVVAAILAGEGEEARAIHRQHRLRARELLIGILKRHNLVRF